MGSVRARITLLATLVIALLIGCGMAFYLILQNRESAVTAETQRHLASLAATIARDYTNHQNFQKQRQERAALEDPAAPGSDDVLSLMTTMVLKNEPGTEGGFYEKSTGQLLGYAFPTHEGPGVKRDIPPMEKPLIAEVARKAANQGQDASHIYHGPQVAIVFEAVPILAAGTPVGSAWVMKRLPSLRSQPTWGLTLGALSFVLLSLICVVLAFLLARDVGSGVMRIEERLQELDDNFLSRGSGFHGPGELATVYTGINRLAESLRQKIEQERGLREQLRHRERLAALGQVAAGVAHELRNPLATIRLRTQMNQRAVADAHLQDSCTIVLEEIDRLNQIVERLLNFSRPLHLKVESFDVAALVEECVHARKPLVGSDSIQFHFEVQDHPILVSGDRSRVRQVLDNLLSNAIDAVVKSGNVWLKVSADENTATIECKDDGHGVPDEIRDKLFDPFFTTRPRGTGLGLSISYEIVQAHRGTLEIIPTPPGTTVRVRLPLAGPSGGDNVLSTEQVQNA